MTIEGLKTGLRVKVEDLTIAFDTEAVDADAYAFSTPGERAKPAFVSPGEYELKNIFLFGVPVEGGTAFAVLSRKWRFGYLPFPVKKLDADAKEKFIDADAIFTLPDTIAFVRSELNPRAVVTSGDGPRIAKIAKALNATYLAQSRVNLKTVEANLINLHE